MAHDVFVSYANKDKATADAVVATLEQHQIRCWIAPRDVLPGQDYAEILIEAIGDAQVMVLVFSSNSNNSSHVLREVERAASKGIAILPLRIEDVPPSRSMEYFISSTHWLDALTPPLERHLKQLAETVQSLLARAGKAAPAGGEPVGEVSAPTVGAVSGAGRGSPPPAGVRGFARRWGSRPIGRLVLGAGAIAVAAVIVYFAFQFGGGGDGTNDGDTSAIDIVTPTATVAPTLTPEDTATPTPEGGTVEATTTVASGGVVAVAPGSDYTCALTEAGGVKCWGANGYGQLGDGTTTISDTPVDVCATGAGPPCTPANDNVLTGVIAIVLGKEHTCALTSAGAVKCWGGNDLGQLGTDTTSLRTTPVDVKGLESDVIAIKAGWAYTCALTTAGGVKCWGRNSHGQLGDGTTTNRPTAADVPGLTSGIASVAAGVGYPSGYAHTCAVTTVGGLKCWGSNQQGALGDEGTCGRVCTTPVEVSGLSSGVAAVALGSFHTCALTTAGGLKCWGYNASGQLGDGTTTGSTTPVIDVLGLTSGVAAVAAGANHTCALTTAGGVKCWGENRYGQLGNGTTDRSTAPVEVSGLTSGVTAITAGGNQTCAITTAGGVTCWGNGQLTPVEVLGLD